MTHARVIVNPMAGAGRTARQWPRIMTKLRSIGLGFESDLTEAPGHAIELARSAAKKGYEFVVSVGGDGTLNEIVNGLHESGGLRDITLGIINTGTGADYIRTIGIPRHYEQACQCLVKPGKLVVDLGVVEYMKNGGMVKRLFVNFAGIGFDAEIVKATNLKFKALGSISSYLLGVLTTFLSYRNREVSLKLDGRARNGKVCTVVMSHGKYGGGGMFVAPNADPTDGLLDVMIIDEISKLDLLRSLPQIYKGTHLTHPRVTTKRAREVEIRPAQKMSIQADGELLGETPAHFSILPGMLTIAV
ncbi:MAG: diacylglycerol kinase family protein [Chloroflexota bacterium]